MKQYTNENGRKSIRLHGYDYSRAGLYFITLCTQNRLHLFGHIENGILFMNDAGRAVEKWYREIEHKYPDKQCHQMVVMPNHFHCIIEIMETDGITTNARCDNHDAYCYRDGKCVNGDAQCVNGNAQCVNQGAHVGAPLRGRPVANNGYFDNNERLIDNNDKRPVANNGCFDNNERLIDNNDKRPVANDDNINVDGHAVANNDNINDDGRPVANNANIDNNEYLIHNNGRPVANNNNIANDGHAIAKNENAEINKKYGMHNIKYGATIGDVMDWFKTMTTNEYIRGVKNNDWQRFEGKLWQRNYYDHIIRNEQEHARISEYIIHNPMQWKDDKFHTV